MGHRVLLLLAIVAFAQAGPLTSRQSGSCAVRCTDPATAYTPGRSYTFNYMTSVRSHIKGGSADSSGLRLSAKLVFDILTPCEMAMRMLDVQVSEQDPTSGSRWLVSPHQAEYERELTISDIHFTWNKGLIPEVCAVVDEPEWVLNIKKAAISLLQNTNPDMMKAHEGVETDISGRCAVSYTPVAESGWLGKKVKVSKETDLMSCLDQQKVRSSFQSSSYRVPARIQSMPLTKANRTCLIVYYSSGNVEQVRCTEEHIFRPFSTEESGATTFVEQQMEFVNEGGMVKLSHDHKFKRSRLEYQHHEYSVPSKYPLEDVKSVLRDLCELGAAIDQRTPIVFNELIHRLRKLSSEEMSSIKDEVNSLSVCRRHNHMAKQFFFDALPAVSTAAAAEVMKDLILNNRISSTEADIWLTSLAFIQQPSKAMLINLLPLLKAENPSVQAQLGIGALVNQFCKTQPECEKDPVVKEVGEAFKRLIGSDCSTGDRKRLLVALKAIGNAGYLQTLMPTLVKCTFKETNSMDVRVAAIEALRRTPCSVNRSPLLALIRNKHFDSELRITAYLGLMVCPNIELFDTVKELLTAESSNQFASFIWTHLTNLLETSDPHKQDIRLIVEDVKLKRRYDLDKLKFSRNIEKSFFSNYLNTGAKVESNLIWSQRSFLPRSATLNMTMDLFGKSFNFFEIGGRVQGLESLLEKYLGPKGMERKNEVEKNAELAELDRTFKMVEDKIGGNLDVKVFGHQIAFIDLWKEDLMRSGGNLMELLSSLKQMREVNWHKSFSFLDSQVSIPTISGFPLKLSVNGTASFVIKSSAKLNLKKLMQWPPEFKIEGKLVPSGAVQVSGMLGISTVYGDHGVKMVSSAHSSTDMQGVIKVSKAEEVKIEILEPRARQNILSAKNVFYIVHRSVEKELSGRNDILKEHKTCTGGTFFEQVLGLEFCADFKYPRVLPKNRNPLASLAAGFEMDLAMNKKDMHSKYVFHFLNRMTSPNYHWKILVDTPGSRIDRKLQAEVLVDPVNKEARAVLATPWKKAKVDLTTETVTDGKNMKLIAEMDGTTYVSVVANTKLQVTGSTMKYSLEEFSFSILDSKPAKVKGFWIFDRSLKKTELKANVNDFLRVPVEIHAQAELQGKELSVKGNVSSTEFFYSADATVGMRKDGFIFAVTGENGDPRLSVRNKSELEIRLKRLPEQEYRGVARVSLQPSGWTKSVSMKFKSMEDNQHRLEAKVNLDTDSGFTLTHSYEATKGRNRKEHRLTTKLIQRQAAGDDKVLYGVESALNHIDDFSRFSLGLNLIQSDKRLLRTSADVTHDIGTVFHSASVSAIYSGVKYVAETKLKPEGEAAYDILAKASKVVSEVDKIEYKISSKLEMGAIKKRISGDISLPEIFEASSEIALDTNADAPSFTAKLTTDATVLQANAQAEFQEEKVVMTAKAEGMGEAIMADMQLDNEEGKKNLTASLFWNPLRRQSDGIQINCELGVTQEAHKKEQIGSLTLQYPMNTIQAVFYHKKQPYKGESFAKLSYTKGKQFETHFKYDINDGWTEKGINAVLSFKTPVPRYRDISISLDGYGSLRVRKLTLETQIDKRRFKTDLLINLGNINNFHSRLSIVTPWSHLSFMKFELKHWLSSTEINSQLEMTFQTKVIKLNLHGFDNSHSSQNDIGVMLTSNSTVSFIPTLSLDFKHKNTDEDFETVLITSNTTHQMLHLNSNFKIYQSHGSVESRGNISLTTLFNRFDAVSLVWDHRNSRHMIRTQSKLTYLPGQTLNILLDAYNDISVHNEAQIGGTFSIGAPFLEDSSVKFSTKLGRSRREGEITAKVPFIGTYHTEVLLTYAKSHLKVRTPHKSLSQFGTIINNDKQDSTDVTVVESYWNSNVIKFTSKMALIEEGGRQLNLQLQTPFEAVKLEQIVISDLRSQGAVKFEFYHNTQKIITLTATKKPGKKSIELETVFESIKFASISSEYAWERQKMIIKTSANFNDQYLAGLHLSSVLNGEQRDCVIRLTGSCPYSTSKLEVIHKTTNSNLNTKAVLKVGENNWFKLENVLSLSGRMKLEIETPFAAMSSTKVLAQLGKDAGVTRFMTRMEHMYFDDNLTLEINGEAEGKSKLRCSMRIITPSSLVGEVGGSIEHAVTDNKFTFVSIVTFTGGRIELKGDTTLESDAINGHWSLRTPFAAFEELAFLLRHRRSESQIEHRHDFKIIAHRNSVEFSNTLNVNGLKEIKLKSQFGSTIHGIERAMFEAQQTVGDSLRSYDGTIKFRLGESVASTRLDWKMEGTSFEGGFALETPFILLNRYNSRLRLSRTDWLYWTTNLKVEYDLYNKVISFEKEIAFRGLKTISSSFQLNIPDRSILGNLKVNALRPGSIVFEGSLNVDGTESSVNAKLESVAYNHHKLTASVTGLPQVEGEHKWERTSDGFKYSASLGTDGNSLLQLSSELTNEKLKAEFKSNLRHTVTSKLEVGFSAERLNVSFDHQSSYLVSPIALKLEVVKIIRVLPFLSVKANLKTPSFDSADATFLIDVENPLKGKSEFDFKVPGINRICYGVYWNYLDDFFTEVSVEFPLLHALEAKMTMEDGEVVVKVEVPKFYEDKWELRVSGSTVSPAKAELNLKFRTPLESVRTINIYHMHNFVENNQLKTEMELPGMSKKFNLRFTTSPAKLTLLLDGPGIDLLKADFYTHKDTSGWDSKLTANWNLLFKEQTLEVRAKFNKQESALLEATVPTLRTNDAYRLRFEGDLLRRPTTAFNVEVQFSSSIYSPMVQVLKSTYGKVSGKRVFVVSLPEVNFKISHGNKQTMLEAAAFNYGVELTQKTSITAINDFEIQIEGKLLGKKNHEVELLLRHKGGFSLFNNKLVVKFNKDKVVDYVGGFKTGDNKLKAEFGLDSVSTGPMTLRAGHEGLTSNFVNYLEITSNHHSPVIFKAQMQNSEGDFSVSLPFLGDAKVQLRQAESTLVSLLFNKDQLATVEFNNNWEGAEGQSRLKIRAFEKEVVVQIKNEGKSLSDFMTTVLVESPETLVDVRIGHKEREMIHLSAQVMDSEKKHPLHSMVLSGRRKYSKNLECDIEFIKQYETLFALNVKHELFNIFSFNLRTSQSGLRHTSLVAKLAEHSAVCELNNDYTGKNALKFEVIDKDTGKVSFISDYLENYSIQFKSQQVERSRSLVSQNLEIEFRQQYMQPVTMKASYSLGNNAIDASALITSPFDNFKKTEASLSGSWTISAKKLDLSFEQDLLGKHGLAITIANENGVFVGKLKTVSDKEFIDSTKLEVQLSEASQEITFFNSKLGSSKFTGRVNAGSNGISAQYTLEAPCQTIGQTTLNFNVMANESEDKFELEFNNPKLGKNHLEALAKKTIVSEKVAGHDFKVSLFVEKLQKFFTAESSNKFESKDGSLVHLGMHKVQLDQTLYSLSDRLQLGESKMEMSFSATTPLAKWKKISVLGFFDLKDSIKMKFSFDTTLYGTQAIGFVMGDNEVSAQLTVYGLKNKVTVTGWMPVVKDGKKVLSFFTSIDSLLLRGLARLDAQDGKVSASVNFAGTLCKKMTSGFNAAWIIASNRVMVDLKTDFHVEEYSEVWGVTVDSEIQDRKNVKLLLKLTTPFKSIGTSEFNAGLQLSPSLNAVLFAQSPLLGHVKVQGLLEGLKYSLTELTTKLHFDTSIEVLPKFEIILSSKESNNLVKVLKLTAMNLDSNEEYFKSTVTANPSEQEMKLQFGSDEDYAIKLKVYEENQRSGLRSYEKSFGLYATWKGEQYSLRVDFTPKTKQTVKVMATTPFAGYEKVGFKLVGSAAAPLHIEAIFNGPYEHKYQATAILDLSNGIHTRVAFDTPYTPRVELAFQTVGSLRAYKFETTAQYGEKRFSVLTHWDTIDLYMLRVKFESPIKQFQLVESKLKAINRDSKKVLSVKLGYDSKSYKLRIAKVGDDITIKTNDKELVDIKVQMTGFSRSRYTLPSTGSIKIDRLFDLPIEDSKLEWKVQNPGQSKFYIFARIESRGYYVSHLMTTLKEGQLHFKSTAHLPCVGVLNQEIRGNMHIKKERSGSTVTVDFTAMGKKYQLVCITDPRNSIHLQLKGLRGLSFLKHDSLTIQVHAVRSSRVREFSFDVSGLSRGPVSTMFSLEHSGTMPSEIKLKVDILGDYKLEVDLLAKKQGWLARWRQHTVTGRFFVQTLQTGKHTASIESKLDSEKLDANVRIAQGDYEDGNLVELNTLVHYKDGLDISGTIKGLGMQNQAELVFKPRQFKIVLQDKDFSIINIEAHCSRTDYKITKLKQGLLITFMGDRVLNIQAKQEILKRMSQLAGSVSVEVVGYDGKVAFKTDTEKRKLTIETELPSMQKAKLMADFSSWQSPQLHVSYGDKVVQADLDHQLKNNELSANFKIANPWMPVDVKLYHHHSRNKHIVRHEYVAGSRKYTLKSHLITGRQSLNAELHYQSPAKKLKVVALRTPSSLSHYISYNNEKYVNLEANVEDSASTHRDFDKMRTARALLTTKYSQPVEVTLLHHHKNGWRNVKWQHKASYGRHRISHSGRFHPHFVRSRLHFGGHQNEMKIGNGEYLLHHSYNSRNIGTISGTYSPRACTLKFNSDLTNFHTHAKLRHHLGRREGLVSFAQTGSYHIPSAKASWSLNSPSLRGELTLGEAKISLNHVHHSNKEFSCHHKITYGKHHHEFKGEFAMRPSTRSGYKQELNCHASLVSTAVRPVTFNLQSYMSALSHYSTSLHFVFAGVKVMHKSSTNAKQREFHEETIVNYNDSELLRHGVQIRGGVFEMACNLRGVNVYKLEGHCSPMSTRIELSSDYLRNNFAVKIDHNIRNRRQGRFSVTFKSSLPTLNANANWDFAGTSRQFFVSLNSFEWQMKVSEQDEKFHFENSLKCWDIVKYEIRGVFDSRAVLLLRVPHLKVLVESSLLKNLWTDWMKMNLIEWTHDIRRLSSGHFYMNLVKSDDLAKIKTKCSWDFDSSTKKTFLFIHPTSKLFLEFLKTPNTGSNSWRAKLQIPLLEKAVQGSLDASSSWKSGQIKVNGAVGQAEGSWNCEGVEKFANLKTSIGELKVKHFYRRLNDFDFSYELTTNKVVKLQGKVNAADNFITGSISSNLTIDNTGPFNVQGGWNFENSEKKFELGTESASVQLKTKFNSLTDFRFEHEHQILNQRRKFSGNFKIEDSDDYQKRVVAHLNSANVNIDLDHHLTGLRRHKWSHSIEIGDWHFVADGHHHDRESLASTAQLFYDSRQILGKELSWTPSKLEYKDSMKGVNYHHAKVVSTSNELSGWFKTEFYHTIMGAKVSLKKTCSNCYAAELKVGSRGNPKMLEIGSEVTVGVNSMKLRSNFTTPRQSLNVELEGSVTNFNGSVNFTGKNEFENFFFHLNSSVQIEDKPDVKVGVLLYTRKDQSEENLEIFGAEFMYKGHWTDLKHSLGIRFLAEDFYKHSLRTNLKSLRQWKVDASFNNYVEMFGIGFLSPVTDFQLKTALENNELKFKSQVNSLMSDSQLLQLNLKWQREEMKSILQGISRVGQHKATLRATVDSGVTKALELAVNTTFSAVRKIETRVSMMNRYPKEFSASTTLTFNQLKYATLFSVGKQTGQPHGWLKLKVETPHSGFENFELNLKFDRNASHRLDSLALLALGEKKMSVRGSLTDSAMKFVVRLPISGFEKIGVAATVSKESKPGMEVLVHLPHNHHTKVIAEGVYQLNGLQSGANGRLRLETSFRGMPHGEVALNHSFERNILQHTSSMIVGNKQWHNVQFSADLEKGEIRINREKPVRINYKYQNNNSQNNIVGELQILHGDDEIFQLKSQIAQTQYSFNSKSFVVLKTPYRTILINRTIEMRPKGFAYRLEFTPNQQKIAPLAFTFQAIDKSDYSKKWTVGSAALTVPTRQMEASFDYLHQAEDMTVKTMINWDREASDKKMELQLQTKLVPRRIANAKVQLKVNNKKPYTIDFNSRFNDRRTVLDGSLRLDLTDNQDDSIVAILKTEHAIDSTMKIKSSFAQRSGRIDFRLNGDFRKTEEDRDGDISFSYIDTEGRMKTLKSVVKAASDRLSINLVSPTRTCSFQLQKVEEKQYTAYSLSTHGKNFEVRMYSTPAVELRYEPRSNDKVFFHIGYVDSRHLKVDIHRITDTVKMQHLLGEVQLQTRHLFKTKLHWNPTYALLHYSTLRDRLPSMYEDTVSFVKSLQFSCLKDLAFKLSRDLVLPDFGSARSYLVGELKPLQKDFGYLANEMSKMYENNEFFSRSIYQFGSGVLRTVAGYAVNAARSTHSCLASRYYKHLHPHVAYSWNAAKTVAIKTGHHYKRLHGHAVRLYTLSKHHGNRMYHKVNGKVLEYIDVAVDNIRPGLDATYRGYMKMASAYSHYHAKVFSHPILQQLHRRVMRSVENVNYKLFSALHANLRSRVMRLHRGIEHNINKASTDAAKAITEVKNQARSHLNSFMENKHTRLASSFASGAYENSKWFLDNFNIEQNLKDFAKDNYLQAVEYLRQNSIGLAAEYLGVGRNVIIQKDYHQGKFEAHLYSPLRWNDLQSLPTSGLEEVTSRLGSSYKSVQNSVQTLRRKARAVGDVVYESIPDFDMPSGSWIPVFKGVGSVIGDNIVTFDGKHYRFRGNCHYLLTRDFKYRNWAITMSYGKEGKTLHIHAHDSVVSIEPNMHVKVNREARELPLRIGHMTVLRDSSRVVVKDTFNLFKVEVDPLIDSYTISVSRWYHARLGGLLGNFDNEQFDDSILKTGKVVESDTAAALSWKLGHCRDSNMATRAPVVSHPECERLFNSDRSPLHRCFGDVNPAPFLSLCLQAGSDGNQKCLAAALYIKHCLVKSVKKLQMPTQCLKCPVNENGKQRQLLAGQKVDVRRRSEMADVIFVVEERGCLSSFTKRNLPGVVSKMQESLSNLGVSDVAFSLLGFGNPTHHTKGKPYWHTLNGDLTGSGESLKSAVESLELHKDADIDADPLDAIYQAATLGHFRPGAARHIVLLTCSECHDRRRMLHRVREALDVSGVQLHVVKNMRLRTFFYRKSQAYGIDTEKAFSLEAPDGSVELRQSTTQPEGKCVRLALGTRGSAFNLKFLSRSRYLGSHSNTFSRVFADRLASGSDARMDECECAAGKASDAVLMCRRK